MRVKVHGLCLIMAIGLLLAGCASLQEGGPTALPSPVASLAAMPTVPATVAPSATPSPTATASPTASPAAWVILHTNDNWGETEMCG